MSSTEIKSTIQQRLNDYCRYVVNRDFESLGTLFTEDAKLFNPGSPDVIVGRKEIVKIFQSSPLQYTRKTADVQEIEYSGGNEVAAHSIYKNYIDEKLINATKDITAWRLTDGGWAMYLDIYTKDPPHRPGYMCSFQNIFQGFFEEISERTKHLIISYNNGDIKEVSHIYAPNCIIMRQNKPKKIGRESVFKLYSELTYAERLYDTVQTVHGISEDIIHSTGKIITLDKYGHELEKLKYVRLWKRIDGKLLIEWDNANPS